MSRRTSLGLPALITGVVGLSFSACGGSTDGLFTSAGGTSSIGGTSVSQSGSSSGGHATSGGSSSSAGSNATAGTNANGGTDASGGNTNGAGGSVAGSNNAGGSGDAGGNGNAGTGAGGSNSAGTGAGGNAGTSSAGTSSAGTSSGGLGGSSAGAGGAGGTPSCEDLMTLLESQLTAARACDNSRNALQCTGKVDTTCGCQTPVESSDSAETKAYLATLKRFQDKHCVIACTALVCLPIQRAQCQSKGSASAGMCVAVTGPITQ